jgi:hypothetical protein
LLGRTGSFVWHTTYNIDGKISVFRNHIGAVESFCCKKDDFCLIKVDKVQPYANIQGKYVKLIDNKISGFTLMKTKLEENSEYDTFIFSDDFVVEKNDCNVFTIKAKQDICYGLERLTGKHFRGKKEVVDKYNNDNRYEIKTIILKDKKYLLQKMPNNFGYNKFALRNSDDLDTIMLFDDKSQKHNYFEINDVKKEVANPEGEKGCSDFINILGRELEKVYGLQPLCKYKSYINYGDENLHFRKCCISGSCSQFLFGNVR